MRGGRRAGAGRPRGAKNKRTREVEVAIRAVAAQFAEAVPDAFPGDGVALLQCVYKNASLPLAVRIDAAARAARFERPALGATTTNLSGEVMLSAEDQERRRALRMRLIRELEESARSPEVAA